MSRITTHSAFINRLEVGGLKGGAQHKVAESSSKRRIASNSSFKFPKSSMSLPPFTSVPETTPNLSYALALLFEPSPVLFSHLIPQVSSSLLKPSSESITTYAQLIDLSISIIHSWPHDLQARFIAAHPRIGEVKGLSAFSATEQGQSGSNVFLVAPTPPEVLARLSHLNAHRYSGLRYITFISTKAMGIGSWEERA
ncbi:hypothetical protein JAAARDRAFT_513871 [Jaapia argillacea MUCL 33604]|uniref:Oxo-4-hydroxy-4-carboxy-5-ureidoimidazoline decarboxylase domain-containing protein n=1 Tax=Jaapia argillacea MUCL 33604 TaxID=933084 RepID=A0A067QG20_9AGAM|nr:hypothetical protein JAAARDRAFT_513871 [Jaapia argillacea MUCL 33604]